MHHVTFLLAMSEGFQFQEFTSLLTLVILPLFDDSHPSGCDVASHYIFNLHFCFKMWILLYYSRMARSKDQIAIEEIAVIQITRGGVTPSPA